MVAVVASVAPSAAHAAAPTEADAPTADPPTPDAAAEAPVEPTMAPPVAEQPPSGTPTHTDQEVEALRERLEMLERQVEVLRDNQAAVADAVSETNPELQVKQLPAAPAGPPPKVASPEDADHNRPPDYADGFHFGSYGRVVAAGDHRGRAGRDADIAARGSRMDESSYLELELRREDYWERTDSYTRIVATLAVAHPIFHYDGEFNLNAGMRNLYLEESGLGLDKLRVWVGSRMYRGDDIYLLDFWPLDNLNTVGGGAAYTFLEDLTVKVHTGLSQPQSPFFYQAVPRPRPLNQVGDTQVEILDRQTIVSSAKVSNIFGAGKQGGVKPVVYGELHYTNEGQRETTPQQFQSVPQEIGYRVGAQLGAFTGKRSTHLNLVFRYAGGLAAYGDLSTPTQLSPDRDTKGAREVLIAASGNYEVGPFGVMLGSYWRSFRNASPTLDFDDLAEGALVVRPTLWFGDIAGVSVEGSYQAQRRGALLDQGDGSLGAVFGQMGRVGVMPFLSPAGRGNFTRPHLRLMYLLTVRDAGARALYARHDIFSIRSVDHLIGLSAEWWFGSTSYFRD